MVSPANNTEHESEGLDLYTIRPILGKGLGMFATKNIERGTRILMEEVLFSIPEGLSREQEKESVISAYCELPRAKRQAFFNLTPFELDSIAGVLSRYRETAFSELTPTQLDPSADILSRYRANAFEISTLSDQPRPIVKYCQGTESD